MTAPAAGLVDDAALVRTAQGGDREAFAQLYDRYFERIYDFVRRTLRNEADAADVTQEVFIKAMGSIGSLSNPLVFKSWLFTIARNLSISKIRGQRNTLSLDYSNDDESDATLSDILPDEDIGGAPEASAERADLAAMVWAVAAGLDARQYTVLDLSVRQELAPEQMAEVLGVTRNNAYVMMNRTKAAFSESCTDYMLYREGRRECSALVLDLEKAGVEKFSPEARKVLDKHVKRCAICGERKKRLPLPLSMFGGFALAAPPPGLRERIRSGLWDCPIGSAPLEGMVGGAAGHSAARRRIMLVAAAVGALLIALFAGVATLAVLDDAGDTPVAEPDKEDPTTTPTLRPTQTDTAGPGTPTALPAVVSVTASPSAVGTSAVIPPPPTNTPPPGSTATPTATRTNTPTATATATRTPTPTVTPTPVTPSPTPIPPTAIPPSPTPVTPTVAPPPPQLQISTINACWVGATDLKVSVGVSGRDGETVSGTAKFKGMGTDGNLNFGGGSTSNTVTFFTVKDPAGIIAVNVSTPTRNDSRNVAAGGATC